MSRRTRSRDTRVVASTTTGEKQERRLELAEIVAELVSRFLDDAPPDHRCVEGCSHGPLAGMSLMARLQMMVLKGSAGPRSDAGGKGGKKVPAGSPAPWSAQPAELLDEIRQGAARLAAQAREVAGFGPGPDADARGHEALWDALRLLTFLASRPDLREHRLVSSAPAADGLPRRPGEIDKQLRGWHRRALLLTGHEQPWPALRQIPNPQEWHRPGGPLCQDWSCRHPTCKAIRYSRPPKWIQARCPHCGSASLKQEPATGDIVCLRPSCVDAEGRRHTWSVEELERLGVILTQEASAS